MAKTKFTQRPNKKAKQEPLDDTNQKNNWVVERQDVAKQDFLDLKAKLFRTKQGTLDLKDKEFFTFAAIYYYFFDPNNDPDDESVPSDCIRVLRIFLQLTNRKYLDDVIERLGINDLEEYSYDPLEEDETAIDAKKAFYSVVGNCQDKAIAGILITKGAKSGITIATREVTKTKLATAAKQSSLNSPVVLVNSAEEEDEEQEEISSSESDFTLHSETREKNNSPMTRARKREMKDETLQECKRQKIAVEEAMINVNEIQVQKMDKMIEMLASYRSDQSLIVTKMNMLGANIGELPSEKNEIKLLEELNALDTLQESIMQNNDEPSKVNATLDEATSASAEQPKNILKTTTENESIKTTPSKHIEPEKKSDNVQGDKTTTEEKVANVRLSNEDLRISLLTEDELNKEVVALMKAMRFDDAKQLLQRHKDLDNK